MLAATLSLASPAAAASTAIKVSSGQLAPNGFGFVSGRISARGAGKPASFALSRNGRFDRADVILGAGTEKASKGRFKAWLALPDAVTPGKYQLLACGRGKPSSARCIVAGSVKVKAASPVPAATPTLDTAHATTAIVGFPGGRLSVTAADGTVFVLTVPPNSVPNLPVTMTAVSSLTPVSAVGRLVDGVVISPAGDAPPGSTLEIKRPTVPAGAREVAFGGADASGGAYPLPGHVTSDTQVPLMSFGGYGIAVPARGAAADVAPHPVPCDAPAPTASAAGAGSRPLISCVAVAERMRQLSEASAEQLRSANTIGDLAPLFSAAAGELASEISRITTLPPTDEGGAELEQILVLAIGVERQAELLGLHDAVAALEGDLAKAALYHYNLVKSKCTSSKKQSSEVYIEFFFEALAADRQSQLLGNDPGDIAAVEKACLTRIKLQLTGHDDGSIDNGQWTEHVVTTGVATIKGTDNLGLESDDPNLTFDSVSSTADPQLANAGGTVTTTSTSGKMHGEGFTISATKHIRCDKNRKFVVERHAVLYVTPLNLWGDAEQTQISIQGFSSPGPPIAAGAQSWQNDYSARGQQFPLGLDDGNPTPNTISKSNSGPCTHTFECTTFSYKASLEAKPLVN